jgi:hypothetical protein
MLTFTKDGGVKYVDEGSSVIAVLKADGWKEVKDDEPELKSRKTKKHEIEGDIA